MDTWMIHRYEQQQKKQVKLYIIRIKNFYMPKNIIKKVKRQPTECEKIFANHISDEDLVSRIYKELL